MSRTPISENEEVRLKSIYRAVYPGSFDPITFGHTDLIERLSAHFDELIVLISESAEKNYFFSLDERVDLTRQSVQSHKNVKVELFKGLTVDFATQVGARVIIRGLRAVSDFEYEFAMANMNRKLASKIETMIVFTSPQYSYISSRMVKEVAFNGGNIADLVPKHVETAILSKMKGFKK